MAFRSPDVLMRGLVMTMNLSKEWGQFFELSRDLLCVLDLDGRVLECSRSWQALSGVSREDMATKPFLEFLHPEDRTRASVEMESLKRKSATANVISRFRSGNGSYK